jgi:hypothetical protein
MDADEATKLAVADLYYNEQQSEDDIARQCNVPAEFVPWIAVCGLALRIHKKLEDRRLHKISVCGRLASEQI